MKIAIGQVTAAPTIEENVANLVPLVEEAAKKEARILLLSELFLQSYNLPKLAETGGADLEDIVTRGQLSALSEAAKENNLHVFFGAAISVTESERPYNSMLWINTDGAVHEAYRKIHSWDEERAVLNSGTIG